MGRLTKEHERALFIAEFLRRLRGAAHGERVYMRVGDMFKDADVIDLVDWQAARSKMATALIMANRSGVVGRHVKDDDVDATAPKIAREPTKTQVAQRLMRYILMPTRRPARPFSFPITLCH